MNPAVYLPGTLSAIQAGHQKKLRRNSGKLYQF